MKYVIPSCRGPTYKKHAQVILRTKNEKLSILVGCAVSGLPEKCVFTCGVNVYVFVRGRIRVQPAKTNSHFFSLSTLFRCLPHWPTSSTTTTSQTTQLRSRGRGVPPAVHADYFCFHYTWVTGSATSTAGCIRCVFGDDCRADVVSLALLQCRDCNQPGTFDRKYPPMLVRPEKSGDCA